MLSAIPERGETWLQSVISYHCGCEYGRRNGLQGFDDFISALKCRQNAELKILEHLGLDYMIVENPARDYSLTYSEILKRIRG